MEDNDRIYIMGETSRDSGYAQIEIIDSNGNVLVNTPVDFYSLTPASGLRYVSPKISKGNYILRITVSEMKPNWSDKKKNEYGSKGHDVRITEVGTIL